MKKYIVLLVLAISLIASNACCGGSEDQCSCCGGSCSTYSGLGQTSSCGCKAGCGGGSLCKSECGCLEYDKESTCEVGSNCCYESGEGTCNDGSHSGGSDGGHGQDHTGNVGDSYWEKVGGKKFEFTGKTRYYYLAAEEVYWDYAPLGFNGVTGQPFTPAEEVYTKRGPGRIGSKYLKCLYHEYTSSSFTTLKKRTPHEEHLGFMGPTIHAEVGDMIKIVFYNKCRFPATIHPHGVFYNKDGEGAIYEDGTSGYDKNDDGVPTGGKHTYVWKVPDRAGPGLHDGSSVMWMYHSHHHEVIDFYAGLVGNMVVTRKGMLSKDNVPTDLDKEVFLMYSITDENQSTYLDENIEKFAEQPYNISTIKSDGGFRTSNQMFGINGYIFGNAPLLTLKKGERVRFYIMSMGGGRDVHTPHWHGNVVHLDGMKADVASVLPAEMIVADMVPDAVGVWLHHCHVHEHFLNGMITQYKIVE